MISPNEFEREFSKLESDLSRLDARDERFVRLTKFAPRIYEVSVNPLFNDYIRDYVSLFQFPVDMRDVTDLLPDELTELTELLAFLREHDSVSDINEITDSHETVTHELARKLVYVDEIEKSVRILSELYGIESGDADCNSLQSAIESISDERINNVLREILNEQNEYRAQGSDSSTHALFVEKADGADHGRGRLRTLRTTVETLSKRAESDTVTFDNRPKSPDDPFVGAAFNAIEAVRSYRTKQHNGRSTATRYGIRLSIDDTDHTFTGDSIGLAAALVVDVNIRRDDVTTRKSLVACDVAVTGGIDADGNVTGVNEKTLRAKIERTFFSPVRHIAVPEANFDTARATVADLTKVYPHRNLYITPIATLSDAIENRNIIRDERVCPLDFAGSVAKKYGRMAKVQIPALISLVGIFLLLLYPWLDRNPTYANLEGQRLIVRNCHGKKVFSHSEWDGSVECARGSGIGLEDGWNAVVANIDDDEANEVVFCPRYAEDNKPPPVIVIYDDDGTQICYDTLVPNTDYPGDIASCGEKLNQDYACDYLAVSRTADGKVIIITVVQSSNPIRDYIQIRNGGGRLTRWMLHRGGIATSILLDIDNDSKDEILFGGINNPIGRASLFGIDIQGNNGLLPPHDFLFECSGMPAAEYLFYMSIPNDLCDKGTTRDGVAKITPQKNGGVTVDVSKFADGCFRQWLFDEDFICISIEYGDDFLREFKERQADTSEFDLARHIDSLKALIEYY